MTKKHDKIFDDVLSGLGADISRKPVKENPHGASRFLKRSNALGDRLAGETEEKTLRWVDPEDCRMWERHNRDYALLNEDNCRDLIDGIRAQGRQEFPAIVRRTNDGKLEVICGARRHFAVSWLRANNYSQFKYLVEVRDLSDEEAFRLADIENRDRADISDYERACDYADAIRLYYGGKQKSMAARLEVSEAWLSRYLNLAKLPAEIVAAFADKTDIKELHARTLKPLLADPQDRKKLLVAAAELAEKQATAKAGQGGLIEAPKVMAALKAALKTSAQKATAVKVYKSAGEKQGVSFRKKGRNMTLEFSDNLSRAALSDALQEFMREFYPKK